MKQIVHIFKKDLRRFSWEIAASLGLLALYAWCQPALWEPPDRFMYSHGSSATLRYMGAYILGAVLVLGWMIILVRLIYEESPAGDRQFWVTRPYHWPNLLAAKILFVVAIINVPLFIVQLGLLKAAGFAPFPQVPRLIYMHLLLAAFALPIATIAVITGGRTQMTRAAIVVLIFLALLMALGLWQPNISEWARPTAWDWVRRVLMIGVPIVIIVRQYWLRKTVQSQLILLGAALALILLLALQPKRTLILSDYPLLAAGGDGYFEMTMSPPKKPQDGLSEGFAVQNSHGTWINLNLTGSDVGEGRVAQAEAINVTLQAPDGTRWNSGWQPVYAMLEHYDSGITDAAAQQSRSLGTLIEVERKFFDRVKDVPLDVHVATAATLFRDHLGAPMTPKGGVLEVPGVGTCVISQMPATMMLCRSSLGSIPMVGVNIRLFKSCASGAEETTGPVLQSHAWAPNIRWAEDFGLSPVNIFTLYAPHEVARQALTTCAASTFTFRQPERVKGFRVEQDFTGVKLADLVVRE